METLFCIHSLAGSDCHHLVDIIYRAASAEIIYRTGDTLEDRTDRICVSKSLDELISDISDLKAREHEHIRMSGDF